jgi:hypothetical protein
LAIQIGGATAGAQFDKVAVTSMLTAGGTLQVSLINGFIPTVGQAFDILDWGSLSGTFATLPSPANWDTSDLYTLGVVKFVALGSGSGLDGGAVPEPTAFGLLILAALGFATRRTGRRS